MSSSDVGTTSSVGAVPHVGILLKEWRGRRRRSQMDLALDVGVSTRHLSFIETGRANPSPEVILALANGLDVPLRQRNAMLLAGGFAPRYAETPISSPDMAAATAAVQRLLDAHDPYPGVALDRRWDVLASNTGAMALLEGLPAELLTPPINVFRVSLHPGGLAGRTRNFAEWGSYMRWQLDRLWAATADPALGEIRDEVLAYPNMVSLPAGGPQADGSPLLGFTVTTSAGDLSLFSTLTTFGTPLDVTLDELLIELFYPADDATAALLRR